jgi:hypothetical protein
MFFLCSSCVLFAPWGNLLNHVQILKALHFNAFEADCTIEGLAVEKAGGARENIAALNLIAELCPPGRGGIWHLPELTTMPNRTPQTDSTPNFVPNRTNEWGDPIFPRKAAAAVGLSRVVPVYATTSRCAI